MTKAGRKSSGTRGSGSTHGPAKRVRLPESGCWVDIYEKAWFGGRLRRLQGPGQYPTGASRRFGSIIVGPGAKVVHLDRQRCATLPPRQVVPNLAAGKLRGKLRTFEIVSA